MIYPKNTVQRSTLDGMNESIIDKRRSGNTTRLIDNAIQILFRGEVCIVEDHHEGGKNHMVNNYLLDRILKRLIIEHSQSVSLKKIDIDRLNLKLWIKE